MYTRLTSLSCALLLSAACVRDTTPAPTAMRDVFEHERAQVDVLMVVDDSLSMVDDRAELADSYPELVELFGNSGVDWHLGVISTGWTPSNGGGRLQQAGAYRWLDESTPNPAQVFAAFLQGETQANPNERARRAIHDAVAVHDAGYNAGFLRADAQLAAIVFSDEDDHSATEPSVEDFATWLEDLRSLPDDTALHAMVSLPGAGCGSTPGVEHMDAAEQTGGLVFDLCERDFVGATASVTDTWWSSPPYPLTAQPVSEIEVLVTEPYDEQRPLELEAWVYEPELNAIRITPAYRPPIGTHFEVRYMAPTL